MKLTRKALRGEVATLRAQRDQALTQVEGLHRRLMFHESADGPATRNVRLAARCEQLEWELERARATERLLIGKLQRLAARFPDAFAGLDQPRSAP